MCRYLVLDVFTDRPLEGNQLAVFPEAGTFGAELMQRLAREMSFSESIFVLPPTADGDACVRIFTPVRELPFAGHPVLGCAVALGERLRCDVVRLETQLATIAVQLEHHGGRAVRGRMRQPVPPWRAYERVPELLAALGVERSGLPVELYEHGPSHVYVELASPEAVAALRPDLAALAALGDIAVNCFAGAGHSWKTRMFAPAAGVIEDAATGSAAGPLALHLVRHGRLPIGEEIVISQGAEIGRPSTLLARVAGSGGDVGHLEVAGSAVLVAEGRFSLPGLRRRAGDAPAGPCAGDEPSPEAGRPRDAGG